jgi:protoporphyrinogen oxidase
LKIGIIGGGLMGLALAQRLGALGHSVTVFERARQVGGLATWHDFGQFIWDRFYHVILPSDAPLIHFVNDIGLGSELRWAATKTGYYVDHQFYGLSNNVEFLKFPPLSLWSKFRLALTILYCARISDWRRLEKVKVEDWLIRTSGRETFEKFWQPLLLAKLGENYRRVSAVFIWSYIKRLFSARDGSAKKEHMGHVRGGYKTVFDRLAALIAQQGGSIRLGVEVQQVSAGTGGGIRVRVDGNLEGFDKVIFTGPVNVLRQVAEPALVAMNESGRDVEYLGVICMVLATRKPLTPYYVLNIGDERIPFTGVIGMSTIVDTAETAGLHVTYLPKYVLSDDPVLKAPDEDIRGRFLAGLTEMFPGFDHADIQSVHINRAIKVQPLQVIDYSTLVPRPVTRHPDFYVLNTAQFVNNTLNNNEVIRNVNSFFDECGAHFAPAAVRGAAPAGPKPVYN